MTDFPRLIEHAFPLKQTSLDSVHEKNVRHGHISTLHIWPARRPLAACRAALIATLLPDPGDPEKRRELCEKIAGKVVKKIEKKKMPNGQTVERVKEETVGGILHWGRETENAETLEWFRQEIKKAYGGRAPKVLDPFAGGGAIPLEAMRLGCEATAVDINPVAWFILKCTLEYPQKLAGQTRPLPEFILRNDDFMAEFFKKAKGYGKAETKAALKRLHDRFKKKPKRKAKEDQISFQFALEPDEADDELQADLAWHVRAWGQWVLDRARRELAQYYPTYADFEPIKKDEIAYEHQPMRLVPLKEDGTPDIDSLNAEFTQEYLEDKRNPRWIAKPTVAYLWARTVTCKNCRGEIPLLKTLWLCRNQKSRVVLTLETNEERAGVSFGIATNVPVRGANPAQRREGDKRIGAGTMSRSGAKCPCCGTILTGQDIQLAGQAGRLGKELTAVVYDTSAGKRYRLPTDEERLLEVQACEGLNTVFGRLPFGQPDEVIPKGASRKGGGSAFTAVLYGLDQWTKLFTSRQLLMLGTFALQMRELQSTMTAQDYSRDWSEATQAFLTAVFGRVADRASTLCTWTVGWDKIGHTFARFALPITWDFAESSPLLDTTGGFPGAVDWVARYIEHAQRASHGVPRPIVRQQSAIRIDANDVDIVVTDPPYYDAIPYSDLMDFFYVWIRRILREKSPDYENALSSPVGPKWNHETADGELIDDAGRHAGDRTKSKAAYEEGMFRAFEACHSALRDSGRMVIVFAHKQPDAWETLVSAIIRAGFVVDGSWPIQTEMGNRTRALVGSALASSVWLVCRKRHGTARPGWDNQVIEEMRTRIAAKLREYWDAGIRGPDFVWAATGPAMEAYSKHPVVRKANEPNATMGVGEFLHHVRRMVVDYVVGQVLTGEKGSDLAAADRLDEVTAYYLLHRHDFGMDEAPVGACILYATACGLSDAELDKTWNILAATGKATEDAEDSEEDHSDPDDAVNSGASVAEDTGGGSKVKLKAWSQRRGKSMGYEAPEGRVVPLIDRIHRVMHLWKEGDVQKVDEYLDQHALRRNELFKRVIQSLIELSSNSERSLLESISNHIGAKGEVKDRGPMLFSNEAEEE